MKLSIKLMIAPVVTTALLLAGTASGLWLFNDTQKNSEREFTTTSQLRESMDQQRLGMAIVNAAVYRTVALIGSMDGPAQERARKNIAGQTSEVAGMLSTLATQASDGPLKAELATAHDRTLAFGKAADAAIDMAAVDPNTGVAALQSADAEWKKASEALTRSVGMVNADSTKRMDGHHDRTERWIWVAAALAGLASLATLWMARRVQRQSMTAIHTAVAAAAVVADGNLQPAAFAARDDEIGDLLKAQARMVAQMHDVVAHVRDSAQALQTASAEVASGSFDLSNRTVQTAASLQQANSSMEELAVTLQSTADAAEQANTLVASATEVAVRGGQVVAEVVATMQGINDSSRRIADIIGVIDGIAFQTNILALNAAVEAARAGEQGRGFAVVASEVRGLAHRSASAAKEIKGLIGDSVGKVQAGAELVGQAGETMRDIVVSVRKVQDIIATISAAATQQSAGISQVNSTVAELENATQQNAALVEESAAAADNLKQQSALLAATVATFTLSDSSHPAATPSATEPSQAAQLAREAMDQARQSSAASAAAPVAAVAAVAATTHAAGEWEEF
jgi:methyl-accepting chemotaxis protein